VNGGIKRGEMVVTQDVAQSHTGGSLRASSHVLYGHTLLTNNVETQLFILRAGATVALVEVFLNWLPYYILGIDRWRRNIWYVVVSGVAFGLLTYLVIPPPRHEGEAFIGMSVIWIIVGLAIHGLFRKLGWYS